MPALKFRARSESDRRQAGNQQHSLSAFPEQGTYVAIVGVKGALRTPVTSELSQTLDAMIRRGDRRVLLDLAELHDIDAAGVGELVCAFNAMSTAGGVLRIARANRHVRSVLQVTGVFTLLAGCTET